MDPQTDNPDNNKEQEQEGVKQMPQAEPQPKQEPTPENQPLPDHFTVSREGVDELAQAMNEVIASKYVKQVLFNVINAHFKPVFVDTKES